MNGEAGLQAAGFWRRLVAFFVDYILFSSLIIPLLYAAYGRGYFLWLLDNDDLFATYGMFDLLLTWLLPLLLLIVLWRRLGATPGKILLDCRVVDAQTLSRIPLRSAIIRALGYLVSALPAYLGFVWIAFDRRKQGLHDKLAGTLVLHDPDDYANLSLQELMDACE